MGVQGTGGVGGASSRRSSHVAYYVALAAILGLLALLLLYFFYFFVNKIRKFNSAECIGEPSSCRPPPASAYPVQPVVREGASEMARLCKQLPPPGKGDTVFPTSTSPAAIRAHSGETPPEPAVPTVPTVPSASNLVGPPITEAAPLKSAPAVPSVVVEPVATQ